MITKKGKSEGTTQVAHRVNPFVAAVRFDLEKTTKQIATTTKKQGRIFLFKDINQNLIDFT